LVYDKPLAMLISLRSAVTLRLTSTIVKDYQGLFFAYELTAKRLSFKLFRLIPLVWVDLKDVDCMRVSSHEQLIHKCFRNILRLFKYEYWPSFVAGQRHGLSALYVIKTDNSRYIYIRIKPGFHYRLRSAIGAWAGRRRPPPPLSEPEVEAETAKLQ
jgi:hypothetical protein